MKRPQSRLEFIAAIAEAENEMYLRVAKQFAEEDEPKMTATVFEWAALALQGKSSLAKRVITN